MTLVFFETPLFTRKRPFYLDEENYRQLQNALLENPQRGSLMPETGGFRKLRWLEQRRGKGKCGGLRIIYYYFATACQIWLFTIYDKPEMTDLTKEEKQLLKKAIQIELAARRQGRT